MKACLLKLHRWAALTFALPLIFVLGTGLALSFEPWLVTRSIEPGSLTPAAIQSLLQRHDPEGRATALAYRSYDKTLTIGAGRRGGTVVDVVSGEARSGPSALANALGTLRRMHETLLIDARWLVTASTVAMLALALLGVLMGWPRISNTLAGWHKAMAWWLLPLVVLSPLSALFMVNGLTFSGAPPAAAAAAAPATLAEAVDIVGKDHDLSGLVWLRPQGKRLLARIAEDGEYRVYAVTAEGATPVPPNWSRLWHEGNFAGAWSSLLNVVASLAMIGLLVTGPWLWLRRRRLRSRRARAATSAAPAATDGRPA